MSLRKRFSTILLFLLFITAVEATVCRLPGLNGFDFAQSRGEKFVGANTSSLSTAKMYVEMTTKGPWFHSNYVTPKFDYPTKIGGENITDAETAFFNIALTPETFQSNLNAVYNVKKKYTDSLTIYVDQSVFNKDGTSKIDFGDASKVIAVDGKSGVEIGKIEKIERSLLEPTLSSVRALGCCFFAIPPGVLKALINRLKSIYFDKNKVEIVSLVKDSATADALKNSNVLKNNVKDPAGLNTRDQLTTKIKNSSGKTLIVVGHVEGKSFVVRDSKGLKSFEYGIEEIHILAKDSDAQLVLLGCETAKSIDLSSHGNGVVGKFNTIDAIVNLEKAVSKSKNYADFFENLASPELKLVAGEKLLSNSDSVAQVTIYSRVKDTFNKHIAVGVAYLLGKKSELNLPSPSNNLAGRKEIDFEKIRRILKEKPIKGN